MIILYQEKNIVFSYSAVSDYDPNFVDSAMPGMFFQSCQLDYSHRQTAHSPGLNYAFSAGVMYYRLTLNVKRFSVCVCVCLFL